MQNNKIILVYQNSDEKLEKVYTCTDVPTKLVFVLGFDLNLIWFVVFNATFSNISAISWRPVLVVEEARENHRPWASNW